MKNITILAVLMAAMIGCKSTPTSTSVCKSLVSNEIGTECEVKLKPAGVFADAKSQTTLFDNGTHMCHIGEFKTSRDVRAALAEVNEGPTFAVAIIKRSSQANVKKKIYVICNPFGFTTSDHREKMKKLVREL